MKPYISYFVPVKELFQEQKRVNVFFRDVCHVGQLMKEFRGDSDAREISARVSTATEYLDVSGTHRDYDTSINYPAHIKILNRYNI